MKPNAAALYHNFISKHASFVDVQRRYANETEIDLRSCLSTAYNPLGVVGILLDDLIAVRMVGTTNVSRARSPTPISTGPRR